MELTTYLARLQQHIHSLPTRFAALGEEFVQHPIAEGKWSRKQILGHLIDSAANNWQRHARIIGKTEVYHISPYPQDTLVKANRWQDLPLSHMLRLWQTINQQMHFLLSEEKMDIGHKTVQNPDGTEVNFAFWLTDYIEHLDHHLKQIFGEERSEDGQYHISTDPSRLDIEFVYQYLTHSYWAEGRSRDAVQTSIENSLNFGLYQGGKQIGFARVMTDNAVFAHLCDVFVDPAWRGKKLGQWLVETAVSQPGLQDKRWTLATHDAHDLYRKFGFEVVDRPDRLMGRLPAS